MWLEELRAPDLLRAVIAAQPGLAADVAHRRPAVAAALAGDTDGMRAALLRELQDGLDADAAYQKSLSRELEAMRQQARRDPRQEHPPEP